MRGKKAPFRRRQAVSAADFVSCEPSVQKQTPMSL